MDKNGVNMVVVVGISPGCSIMLTISSTDSITFSSGAWSTMIVDPTIQSAQPSCPFLSSCSRKSIHASTALQRGRMKDVKIGGPFKNHRKNARLPNHHAQATNGGNQNGRGEGVGGEVKHLANGHWGVRGESNLNEPCQLHSKKDEQHLTRHCPKPPHWTL